MREAYQYLPALPPLLLLRGRRGQRGRHGCVRQRETHEAVPALGALPAARPAPVPAAGVPAGQGRGAGGGAGGRAEGDEALSTDGERFVAFGWIANVHI